MTIAAVQQVYEETRRLTVAGSSLAAGDFRLKKLIEPLEKSAVKAPVFGKVAEAVRKVVDCSGEGAATALLDLGTLATAILYTQGESAAAGELAPLKTKDLGLASGQTSARILKPLIEALTSTGSGRVELIKDAFARGEFKDLRLVTPAVHALNDPYPEIADFIASEVLPLFGTAVLPDLQAGYNKKGKTPDARRLKLMHQLDPSGTNPLITEALDEGSKEVKLAAIECLGEDEEAVPFLLEQAKARATDVRRAALIGLCRSSNQQTAEVLFKALATDDVELIAADILKCPHPEMTERVVKEADRRREEIFEAVPKSKDPKKDVVKRTRLLRQFQGLVSAFAATATPTAVEFLRTVFRDRERWIKAGEGIYNGDFIVTGAGEALLLTGSLEAWRDVAAAAAGCNPSIMRMCFLASALTEKPARVFEQFGPVYKAAEKGKSKAATDSKERSEAIAYELARCVDSQRKDVDSPYLSPLDQLRRTVQLDDRWLELALEKEDLGTVLTLARPKHPGVRKFLLKLAQSTVGAKSFDPEYRFDEVLRLLAVEGAPEVEGLILKAIEKTDGSKWISWYRLREAASVIPLLSAESLPRFEALLPTLDARVQAVVIGYVDELKQKVG